MSHPFRYLLLISLSASGALVTRSRSASHLSFLLIRFARFPSKMVSVNGPACTSVTLPITPARTSSTPRRIGSPRVGLVAHLCLYPVFFRGQGHLSRLPYRMRKRFLTIHMFAFAHGQHGRGKMVVIRRGYGYRVNARHGIQHFTVIEKEFGGLILLKKLVAPRAELGTIVNAKGERAAFFTKDLRVMEFINLMLFLRCGVVKPPAEIRRVGKQTASQHQKKQCNNRFHITLRRYEFHSPLKSLCNF